MRYLFDVNVLLALMDAQHAAHAIVHDWLEQSDIVGWATCPITQNGFIRIISNPKYPNPTRSAAEAARLLAASCAAPGHEFWPDDVSLISNDAVSLENLLSSAQVTDTYLLALAKRRNGRLATLDRRLVVDAVEDGAGCLHLIQTPLQ